MKLSTLHVETIDLLHAIEAQPDATAAGLARSMGRDKSNMAKTLARLRDGGLLGEGLALTDEGRSTTRLLGPDGELKAAGDIVLLRHDEIEPDPDNERTEFDHESLYALRQNILEHGLIQPLVVSPPETLGGKHRIIAGERRWRAIGAAISDDDWGPRWGDARDLIKCVVRADLTPVARAFMRLSENLQRADLHPLDEGAAYHRLVHPPFDLDTAAIADAIGRSQRHVQTRMAVADKLGPEDKARMRLPADDPDYLTWRKALELVQTHKPRPAVSVTDKEALVMLEVAHRHRERPSADPLYPGASGWVQLPRAPEMGAASSLVDKGLLEIVDHYGRHFARLVPKTDVRNWLNERGDLDQALWSARAAVIGAVLVPELHRSGRYATSWLNADLPPATAEPEAPKATFDNPTAEIVGRFQEAPDDEDETVSPQGEPTPRTEEARHPSVQTPAPVDHAPREPALSAEPQPAPDLPTLSLELTDILVDVAHKIASPEGVERPGLGRCATVYEYWRFQPALELVNLRLIGFHLHGSAHQVYLTDLGRAWIAAGTGGALGRPGPYETAWLNPPAKDEAKPADKAPLPGPLAPMLRDDFARQMKEAQSKPFVRLGAFDVGLVEASLSADNTVLNLKLDEWPFKLTRSDAERLGNILAEALALMPQFGDDDEDGDA